MKESDDKLLEENININEVKKELNNNNKKNKEKKEEKIDYIKEVKNYMNSIMGDQQYFDLIKSSPELLFESIDEKKIDFWNSCLSNICPSLLKLQKIKIKKYYHIYQT